MKITAVYTASTSTGSATFPISAQIDSYEVRCPVGAGRYSSYYVSARFSRMTVRRVKPKHITPAEALARAGAIVLDPDDCDDAIIAVELNEDGETIAVYDEDLLVEALAGPDGDLDEAREWYEYNTLRALPYMGSRAPRFRASEDEDVDPEGTS